MQRPKGTLDYFGDDAAELDRMAGLCADVFRAHGARPLRTPVFENKEVVMGKYGAEAETKLVYEIADNGGHALVLRYDHTLPMTRFMAEHGLRSLRRYAIGPVYRRDKPAHGRFREFWQADFDVVGEAFEGGEAEVLVLRIVAEIMDQLGVGAYRIVVNTTERLRDAVRAAGVPDDAFKGVCASLDKLDKLEWDQVERELSGRGLGDAQVRGLRAALEAPGARPEWAERVAGLPIVWDPCLARGLEYYDGLIFEVRLEGVRGCSVAAGGRYDPLVGRPAIGLSVGLTRLLSLCARSRSAEREWRDECYVACAGDVPWRAREAAVERLRTTLPGVPVTWSLGGERRLGKVVAAKARERVRWLAIVGGDVVLRDLASGTQRQIAG